MKQLDNMTC